MIPPWVQLLLQPFLSMSLPPVAIQLILAALGGWLGWLVHKESFVEWFDLTLKILLVSITCYLVLAIPVVKKNMEATAGPHIIEAPQYKMQRDQKNQVLRNKLGEFFAQGTALKARLETDRKASDSELHQAFSAWEVSFIKYASEEAKDYSMYSRFSEFAIAANCNPPQLITTERMRYWCFVDFRQGVLRELIKEHQ